MNPMTLVMNYLNLGDMESKYSFIEFLSRVIVRKRAAYLLDLRVLIAGSIKNFFSSSDDFLSS